MINRTNERTKARPSDSQKCFPSISICCQAVSITTIAAPYLRRRRCQRDCETTKTRGSNLFLRDSFPVELANSLASLHTSLASIRCRTKPTGTNPETEIDLPDQSRRRTQERSPTPHGFRVVILRIDESRRMSLNSHRGTTRQPCNRYCRRRRNRAAKTTRKRQQWNRSLNETTSSSDIGNTTACFET